MEQADAVQAYIQAELSGTPTWISLPDEAWTYAPPSVKSWYEQNKDKYRRPVFRLFRALYGHPDSGTFWEQHCDKSLRAVGFEPILNWPSGYVHPDLDLLLIVYVDDFKLSGCAKNLKRGWELIRQHLEVEEEHPANLFLGCTHERSVVKVGNSSVNVCLLYTSDAADE